MGRPDDLVTTRKEVEQLGRRIVALQADVRDRAGLKGAVDQGLAEFGRLGVVCATRASARCTLVEGFVGGSA
ncbi:MAG TPA: hypothetical protein VLH10_19310 [Yinghuangia sp.]|uniref:hypothetical protein n=1 Tax=Yinghuangia sp. YIM S10712 TaxID=3436930 RepID=UPI002C55223C|nr:hypothetical protein [Yinghuangia sp.]